MMYIRNTNLLNSAAAITQDLEKIKRELAEIKTKLFLEEADHQRKIKKRKMTLIQPHRLSQVQAVQLK